MARGATLRDRRVRHLRGERLIDHGLVTRRAELRSLRLELELLGRRVRIVARGALRGRRVRGLPGVAGRAHLARLGREQLPVLRRVRIVAARALLRLHGRVDERLLREIRVAIKAQLAGRARQQARRTGREEQREREDHFFTSWQARQLRASNGLCVTALINAGSVDRCGSWQLVHLLFDRSMSRCADTNFFCFESWHDRQSAGCAREASFGSADPCGEWHLRQSSAAGACTFVPCSASPRFLWHRTQASDPFARSRLGSPDRCGLWHAVHSPCAYGLCVLFAFAGGTPFFPWQRMHKTDCGATRTPCGSWQTRHCPCPNGACVLPPCCWMKRS